MAVLITGLIMGRVIHNDFQDERGSFVDTFWSFNVYVAEALMFLLMGMTVTVEMFEKRWLAMLIGIAALLTARAVGVFGTAPLINRLPFTEPVPHSYQAMLTIGSLRGAVVLALGLSLPVDLPIGGPSSRSRSAWCCSACSYRHRWYRRCCVAVD